MTRGNQREQARLKTMKENAKKNKGTTLPEGMTLEQKKIR